MNPQHEGKFLLQFLSGLSHQKIFFWVWGGLSVFFLVIFVRQFQKLNQRQFRAGGAKKSPPKGTAVVKSTGTGSAIITSQKKS